jgi:hypothetical protein
MAKNFVQRWNHHTKTNELHVNHMKQFLPTTKRHTKPHTTDKDGDDKWLSDEEDQSTTNPPVVKQSKQKKVVVSHSKFLNELVERESKREYNKNVPDEGFLTRSQILRSVGSWSSGVATETSILNAYIELIDKSKHCM